MHRCEPPLFFLSFSTDTDITERFAVFHLLSDRTVHLSHPTGLADEEQFLKVSLYQKRLKLRLLDAFVRVRKSSFCHIKSFSCGCMIMTCNMTFFLMSLWSPE